MRSVYTVKILKGLSEIAIQCPIEEVKNSLFSFPYHAVRQRRRE